MLTIASIFTGVHLIAFLVYTVLRQINSDKKKKLENQRVFKLKNNKALKDKYSKLETKLKYIDRYTFYIHVVVLLCHFLIIIAFHKDKIIFGFITALMIFIISLIWRLIFSGKLNERN